MADNNEDRLPPELEAELERRDIEATTLRATVAERQRTIRIFIVCLFVVIAIGMICLAAVEIAERPPWLVLTLAICGPTGSIVMLSMAYLRMRSRILKQLNKRLDEKAKP